MYAIFTCGFPDLRRLARTSSAISQTILSTLTVEFRVGGVSGLDYDEFEEAAWVLFNATFDAPSQPLHDEVAWLAPSISYARCHSDCGR